VENDLSLNGLMDTYASLFVQDGSAIKGFKASIKVKEDAKPIFFKARPVAYSLRESVEKEIKRLVAAGILYKVESSEWAAPTVNVPKKGNVNPPDVRICGDYKVTVNRVIEDETHPLPTQQDLFASLVTREGVHPKIFTKLDLSGAFQQLELEDDSVKFMAINTHRGIFRYRRLPYGVKTAPAIFQSIMDQVLAGLENVVCFIDDILISSPTTEAHLKTLKLVFQRLKNYNMKLNKEKCKFLKGDIQYLGHHIDGEGIRPLKEKLEAIINAPVPQEEKGLRSFLGLLNFYGKFIPNLSTILHPMYELLKLEKAWVWSRECDEAFKQCKKALTSANVLSHYDTTKPLLLNVDASPYGVGAVLSHKEKDGSERPIAFSSRTLSSAEGNYAQIDKEALAIIYGVVKFHKYLYGRKFQLRTDHQPLTKIFGPKTGIPPLAAHRIQRWAVLLSAYDYEVEYVRSENNATADALSRLPVDSPESAHPCEVYCTVQEELPITAVSIASATIKDTVLSQVLDYTLQGWPSRITRDKYKPFFTRKDELTVEDNCILWGRRVIIPSKYREAMLEELHVGHPGMVKMKALARGYLWWPGLDADLEDCVRSCTPCNSVSRMPVRAPLVPWSWATRPMQRLFIDFAEKNGQHYFVLIDGHSKWIGAWAMGSTTSEKTIAILRNFIADFGLPEEIVSDNGPQFTSEEFKCFMTQNGIRHTRTPPYHPASNGAAERAVQTLKRALEKASMSPKSAQRPLPHVLANFLFTYRNTPHSLTGKTPAELFLKRLPRTRLALVKPSLQAKVLVKQAETKVSHDRKSVSRKFELYDEVRVRQMRGGREKWIPGKVIKINGPLTYIVRVIGGTNRFVHVDHLIPAWDNYKEREENQNIPAGPVPVPVPDRQTVAPASETVVNPSSESTEESDSAPEVPDSAPEIGNQAPLANPCTPVRVHTPNLVATSPPQVLRRSERVRRPPEKLDW